MLEPTWIYWKNLKLLSISTPMCEHSHSSLNGTIVLPKEQERARTLKKEDSMTRALSTATNMLDVIAAKLNDANTSSSSKYPHLNYF